MNYSNRSKRKNKAFKRRRIITIGVAALIVILGAGTYAFAHHKSEADLENNKKVQAKQEEVKKPEPTDVIPGQNIIYAADKYAVPANDVYDMIETRNKVNDEKEVFLTFDDGPSENTSKILKILKENDVHATFFIMGNQLKESEENKQLLKEELLDGNAIANHTVSHNYHKLYPGNSVSVPVFMKELNENNEMMKEILGKDFSTRVIRMPGGYMSRKYYRDSHLKALNEDFKKEGIISIDWNAETGDATGNNLPVSTLINGARKSTKGSLKHIVLLMHDAAAKKTTVDALQEVIKIYKDAGYKFKVIKNAPMSYFESKDNIDKNNDNKNSKENENINK